MTADDIVKVVAAAAAALAVVLPAIGALTLKMHGHSDQLHAHQLDAQDLALRVTLLEHLVYGPPSPGNQSGGPPATS